MPAICGARRANVLHTVVRSKPVFPLTSLGEVEFTNATSSRRCVSHGTVWLRHLGKGPGSFASSQRETGKLGTRTLDLLVRALSSLLRKGAKWEWANRVCFTKASRRRRARSGSSVNSPGTFCDIRVAHVLSSVSSSHRNAKPSPETRTSATSASSGGWSLSSSSSRMAAISSVRLSANLT